MADVPDQNQELAEAITPTTTGIAGLRSYAYSHPESSPGDAPLVAVLPLPAERIAPDSAGQTTEPKRLIVTGTGRAAAIANAWKVWDSLIDDALNLTSFHVKAIRAIEQPSLFRNENDLFFANMRIRVFLAKKEAS